MGKIISTRLIVASLQALQPDQLINFRELEDGSAVTLTPTGQKHKFTFDQLAVRELLLVGIGFKHPLETETPPGAGDPVPNPTVDASVGAGLRPALDPTPNILDKIMETKKTPDDARPAPKKGRGRSQTYPKSSQ